ncbi:MFS transporter [Rhodococcus sp. Eu-32]|uniref:MFS transporter n=1 Tax=Rhodococcus sp. Eu-32 TaxID=1017319 RepID=UPI000F780394|nr:aromatic acid/H+ symport family MFS transporter [Rhodococcus sp. Eu-32]RRQ28980.1 MFS transporter [Rhodococcus sp. Eu-32]
MNSDSLTPVSEDPRRSNRKGALVVLICFAAVFSEGYDLVIYGSVVPALLDYDAWGLDAPAVGTIASLALAGMLVGASVSGILTDTFGRRKVLIYSVAFFSFTMAVCAVAPNPEVFGAFRFLGGLALGGVVPAAITMGVEYAPRGRGNFYNGLVQSGYGIGGVASALLALWLIADHGFRTMFWIGALPLVTLVPIAMLFLPESIDFLNSKGRYAEARATAEKVGRAWSPDQARTVASSRSSRPSNPVSALFGGRYVAVTALFIGAYFIGLLLSYGLNTWLPQIMRTAGYPLDSALTSLVVMSAGGVFGVLTLSRVADHFGAKIVACNAFGIAVISLVVLSISPPTPVFYAALFAAGVGSWGTTVVISGYVTEIMPADLRGSMLGVGLGLGRLGAVAGPQVGAFVMASGLAVEWNFYIFIVPAALGPIILLAMPLAISASRRRHGVFRTSESDAASARAVPQRDTVTES